MVSSSSTPPASPQPGLDAHQRRHVRVPANVAESLDEIGHGQADAVEERKGRKDRKAKFSWRSSRS